jgi:hypothetical protein
MRRCISLSPIEHRQHPGQLRPLIGNRVYGCDDCQLVCRGIVSRRPAGWMTFAFGLDRAAAGLFAWARRSSAQAPGQRDPAHRLRALAAQHRGRSGERRRSDHSARARRGETTRHNWSTSAGHRRAAAEVRQEGVPMLKNQWWNRNGPHHEHRAQPLLVVLRISFSSVPPAAVADVPPAAD